MIATSTLHYKYELQTYTNNKYIIIYLYSIIKF